MSREVEGMTMKRHDDTPARRRIRHVRTAVLALVPLGVNVGCGRAMLREPNPPARPIMVPPMTSRGARPSASSLASAPRRPGDDYGTSVLEMLPPTYRAVLASDARPRPIALPAWGPDRPKPGLDNLLAACH